MNVINIKSLPANNCVTRDIEIARIRLSRFVNQQALHITRVTGINYEESENAPDSYRTVIKAFNQAFTLGKVFKVYAGASENTIYDSPSTNWAFRFWHDYTHYAMQLDFSPEQEKLVGERQCAMVANEFGYGSLEWQLMHLDTVGQVEYFEEYGVFIKDQLTWVKAQIAA